MIELSTRAVANYQQSIHEMPPTIDKVRSRLPTEPTEEQRPIQSINNTFSSVVIPKKKNIALFLDSIPRGMKTEHLNSRVKEGRIHQSQSAESLRHSNVRGIQL